MVEFSIISLSIWPSSRVFLFDQKLLNYAILLVFHKCLIILSMVHLEISSQTSFWLNWFNALNKFNACMYTYIRINLMNWINAMNWTNSMNWINSTKCFTWIYHLPTVYWLPDLGDQLYTDKRWRLYVYWREGTYGLETKEI